MKTVFRAFRILYLYIIIILSRYITLIYFKLNNVSIGKQCSIHGVPLLYVSKAATFNIGNNLTINSGKNFNVIGGQYRCSLMVHGNAELTIGDNVGISNIAIACYRQITIGNDVKIGGGVKIYDTDFHSLNPLERNSRPEVYNAISSAVVVKDGAFLGAHSIILKGAVIGKNAVIGAGSVVTGCVPDNEIWAGNPARFIRTL